MAVQERCSGLYTGLNAFNVKARKPYTTTKQREKWTEEEHKKFVEALKLYGRVWRHIEEHIGTKTAVQIRSHAQKFFTKVTRDYGVNSESSIEIPPPRPKRKPTHPYPRKLMVSAAKEISHTELIRPKLIRDEENQSPTSVISDIGLNPPHDRLSPGHEGMTRRVKLFGKTVVATLTTYDLFNKDINNALPIHPLARKSSSLYDALNNSNDPEDVEKNLDLSRGCFLEDVEIDPIHVLELKQSERSAFYQCKPRFGEMGGSDESMACNKRRTMEDNIGTHLCL